MAAESPAPANSSSADQYIATRLKERIDWYDRKAVTNKRISQLIQYASMILSVTTLMAIHFDAIPRVFAFISASLVTVVVGMERIGQFDRHWHRYRLTAEALQSECELFRHTAGPYAGKPDAERFFVERAEQILKDEAGEWSNAIQEGHQSSHRMHFPKE